jgi:hypothetical protein
MNSAWNCRATDGVSDTAASFNEQEADEGNDEPQVFVSFVGFCFLAFEHNATKAVDPQSQVVAIRIEFTVVLLG